MKVVYRARDAAEAHLMRGGLEARGIRAVVQGDGLPIIAGEVPFCELLPTVQVNDEDFDEAAAVIEELRQPPAVDGVPWVCPTCGETMDAQFTECWQCSLDTDDVTCRGCGYMLRGLQNSGACPECGEPYTAAPS
jgi:predicted RNA-binding Zn-ribbon protein involved in translation (DUF1610 family)